MFFVEGASVRIFFSLKSYSKKHGLKAKDMSNITPDQKINALTNEPTHLFVERRDTGLTSNKTTGVERRQFTNSYLELSPNAAELGRAVDQYKVENRRRFLNYEEMLGIIQSLGYTK